MNIDQCNKWLKNKNINPLTKRKIQTKKATYNKIEKECNEIMKIKIKIKDNNTDNDNDNKNIAAKKIANFFKPLLHKHSGNIQDRINYYKIMIKYLKEYKSISGNNCLKNYKIENKKQLFRIGKRIIINKTLGEGAYGIVFNGYFRPNIKNKQYGKALKLAVKLSEFTEKNEIEAEIYKQISNYVIQNKCPHFSIFYGFLLCNDLSVSNETETSSLITSNSNKPLNINKKDYYNYDFFREENYYLTLTELADGTLYDFLLSKNLNEFINKNFKLADTIDNYTAIKIMKADIKFNCIIQCLLSIVFFHKLTNYSHEDAHLNNYLFHKIKPGGYFHYNIYGVDYYLKNLGVIIILNDFGLIANLTFNNIEKDFTFLLSGINHILTINNFLYNVIVEIINTRKRYLNLLAIAKKSPKLLLKKLQDKIYPLIFKELSRIFPDQLLTTKPNDTIINKIPYSI